MKQLKKFLICALATVLFFSSMPIQATNTETNFEISEFDYGYRGPSDTPLLVILVNLDPSLNGEDGEDNETMLRHTDHSYWSEMFFGDGPKGLKAYFETQSDGHFRFLPAEENYANESKNNRVNDGVVEVSVNTHVPQTTKSSTGDPEREDVLNAVVNNGYVDFTVYDKNKDGKVNETELVVAFIVAGYEFTRNGSQTPSYNAHKLSFNYSFNGTIVSTDYVKCGEMINNSTPLTVGSFCHELGHVLGNGDLYAAGAKGSWGGANSPAGKVSVMAGNGSSGHNRGEDVGMSPSNFDPYHLTVYGLYDYTSVGDGTYTLYSRQSTQGKYNILKVSSPNPSEYYLIENRYFDSSTEHFDSDTNYDGTRGIIIWHVDQALADAGRAGPGMRINSLGTNADIGVAALASVRTSVDDGGTPHHAATSGVFNQAGLVFNCHDYFFPGSETWHTSLTDEQAANFNLKIEILDDPGHEMRIKITGAANASPRYSFITTTDIDSISASGIINVSGVITDLNSQVLTSLTLMISKNEDFSDAVSVPLSPASDGSYAHTFTGLDRGCDYYTKIVLGTKNGDFSKTIKDTVIPIIVEDTTKYQIRFFKRTTAKDKAYSVTAKTGEPVILSFPMIKSGYVFTGWYLDSEYTERFTVSLGKNDHEDIALYARWVEQSNAAKLNVHGATLVNAKVDETGYGVIGETFYEPTVVLNEGERVLWFADAAYTVPFDFTKIIETADPVTAYAAVLKPGQTIEEFRSELAPQNPPAPPVTEETSGSLTSTEETSESLSSTEETSESLSSTEETSESLSSTEETTENTPETEALSHKNCEGGFFQKIWNSILNFFRRIFGMPEICVCGKEI